MAIPSIVEQLAARWKPSYAENTRLGPVKAHFDRMIKVNTTLAAKRVELDRNADLSGPGRAKALRTFVEKEIVPTVARAIRAIDQNEKHLERRRVALLPTVKDKTDIAAAILRAQMRDHLAGMDRGARYALLSAPGADPRLVESVVEAPLSMSGLTPQEHASLLDHLIEREHGPAAAVIKEEAEAVDLVRAAAKIITSEIGKGLDFPHAKAFTEWMDATAEAAGVFKKDDPEIAALSVNALADDAAKLPPAARRTLIDTLMGQQAQTLAA